MHPFIGKRTQLQQYHSVSDTDLPVYYFMVIFLFAGRLCPEELFGYLTLIYRHRFLFSVV